MGLEQYSPATGGHSSALIEDYPEVYLRPSVRDFEKLLVQKQISAADRRPVLEKLHHQGCVYSPKHNLLLIKRFQLSNAAEEAVRFVQNECRGTACSNGPWKGSLQQDHFYFDVIDRAFITFGARVLLPHYPVLRHHDFQALSSQPRAAAETQNTFSQREHREMIEFLVLHKESEGHARLRSELPRVIATGIASTGKKREFLVRHLGAMLGAELHEAYLSGSLSKRYLRALFFRKTHLPGAAKKTYFELARKVNPAQGKLFN
jgi:hypothetical protein